MTKKTVGYVRLEWTCPNCDSRNPGPAKFCMGCGKAQPKDVEFHQPVQEELISDEKEVARAKAGPDIHCPYCGVRNPGDASFCMDCGGDLVEGLKREGGKVLGAHRAGVAPAIKCAACGTENPASATRCSQCGANLALPPKAEAPVATKKPRLGLFIGAGLLAIACIATIVVLVLGRSTKPVDGWVESVSWSRSVGIEELGPTTHEDWLEDIPSQATVGTCEEKYHHTQNDPAPGAVEVCGTPYTVDTGSGYGQVVQDCQYEVYQDYCEYTIEEWQEVDRVTLSGSDLFPLWPEPTLYSGQRLGSTQEEYQVIFSTDQDSYTYTPADANEFSLYDLGSPWLLNVNTFGTLLSVEPVR